jgi:hypothetical protein
LYEAVEQGFLPLDLSLRERAHTIEVRRQALLAEIAGIQRLEEIPTTLLSSRKIEAFCRAMVRRLLDTESGFGKAYLKLFVDEIRLEGKTVILRGSNGTLARAIGEKEMSASDAVPRLGPAWLPMQGSN